MALKDTAEKWLHGGPQAMGVTAAVAVLIGAVIGLGAGYKIEQQRTRSDVKRLQKEIKAGGGGAANAKFTQRIGRVTAETPGLVTVATTKNGTLVVLTSSSTKVSQAQKGAISDVVVGRRILSTVGGHEIIVLPTDSALGRSVKSVGKDSVDLSSGNGAPAVHLLTKDVKVVETVTKAKAADVTKGTEVLSGGRTVTKGVFNASEVIILPADSLFVS